MYDSLKYFISPNAYRRSNKFVFKVTQAFKRKTWILWPYQSMARQSTAALQVYCLWHIQAHKGSLWPCSPPLSIFLLPMLQDESLKKSPTNGNAFLPARHHTSPHMWASIISLIFRAKFAGWFCYYEPQDFFTHHTSPQASLPPYFARTCVLFH